MKPAIQRFPLFLFCAVLLLLGACSDVEEQTGSKPAVETPKAPSRLVFGGGPPGGTFNFFANRMALLISTANDMINVTAQGSAGSLANLHALNSGEVDMAIVYGGDAFLGRKGRLVGDGKLYDNIRSIAYLYGAPVQLVVRKGSGINTVRDLAGKRVAIGNPGSGAALSAERFFRHTGLWESLEVVKEGYARAATEFLAGQIDAFWVLVGYPNASVIEAANNSSIALLDVHLEAQATGFYAVYPFYNLTEIPSGTYKGQDRAVITFQDVALWCAGSGVNEEIIYDSLCAIYCTESLEAMIASHKAASEMSVEGGVRGVSIPLHPGAARFWEERGVTVPPSLRP